MPGTPPAVAIKIHYLTKAYDEPPPLSLVDPILTDNGVQGARLAIADNNKSGAFLGQKGGLSFIRRLRLHDQRTPVLVFTMHSDPVIVSRALEVGATGYVLKDTSSDEVLKAFRRCAREDPISVTTSPPRWPSWKRGAPPIR